MYLLRTMLSYSLVIVVVVAAVFAYQYRDQIVPDAKAAYEDYRAMLIAAVARLPTTKEVTVLEQQSPASEPDGADNDLAEEYTSTQPDAVVAQHDAEQEDIVEVIPEPQPEPQPEQVVDTQVANSAIEQAQMPVEQIPAVTQEIAAQLTAEPEPVAIESAEVVEPAPATVAAAMDTQQQALMPSHASPEPRADAPSQDQDVAVIEKSPPLAETSLPSVEKNLLAQARDAFWRGQLDSAVDTYQKLTDANPADPNAFGELGNVYYAMGNWEQAGNAYYEAARLLIQRNQTGQLDYLLRVLHGLNPEKAKELQQKIRS